MTNGESPQKKQSTLVPETPLKEGEDYYMEGGRFVFTEQYHLKRGHCCGSGCRHCPYNNKKKAT